MYEGMNSDSVKFLSYFMPKGGKLDLETARWIARSLHLAFKGMNSGEVYDVLMQQFLVAVAKYDPVFSMRSRGKMARYQDGSDRNYGRQRPGSSAAGRSGLRISSRAGSGITYSNGLRKDSRNWKQKKGYTAMGSVAGRDRKHTGFGPATRMVFSSIRNPKRWSSLVAAAAGLALPSR